MADGEECEECEGTLADLIEMMGDVVEIGEVVFEAASVFGDVISKVTPTRQCFVKISNESSKYILRNPRLHADTGRCARPLPVTIKPKCSGEGLFTKRVARGSGGVFTYDLYNSDEKTNENRIAVLFKVPLDLNLRSVVFAIGIVDMDTECDRSLFKNMFRKKPENFVRDKAGGSSLTFERDGVTLRANMSDSGEAILTVEVSED